MGHDTVMDWGMGRGGILFWLIATLVIAALVYVSSSKEPKIWIVDQKTLTLKGAIALPASEGHQMAAMP